MDYKKILLDGLIKKRRKFPEYLVRQYKNAPEDVPPDVFFKHLKKVIKIFEEDIKRQLNRDKREWTLAMKDAQERGDKEALKRRKEALNSLDINDYSLNIGGQYLLNMNDIHFLKASIEQAYTTSVLIPIKETMDEIQKKINEKIEILRRRLIDFDILENSTKELFRSAVENKYPEDAPRILWTGTKRDAAVFCRRIGMTINEWNKCFKFQRLKPLNRDDFKHIEEWGRKQSINYLLNIYESHSH